MEKNIKNTEIRINRLKNGENLEFVIKYGYTAIFHKYDYNDYSLTITDNPSAPNEGGSIRGSANDVIEEFSRYEI